MDQQHTEIPTGELSASPPVQHVDATARHGWSGTLSELVESELRDVLARLQAFVADADQSQINAWRESVQLLRKGASKLIACAPGAASWGLVLEYELPLEARRTDAVLLAGSTVFVLEFKGKVGHTDADLDQTHAYARDLRCYL